MRANREKLLPWLVQKIDSEKVPGLRWMNKEKTDFRITWKHAGKPDFNLDKDAVLFRMWAEHTGKYKPGEQPDPSTWKTRFRCALRKQPDIDEVPIANSLDENDPYRVFRLKSRVNRIPLSHTAPAVTPSPDDVTEVSPCHDHLLHEIQPGCNYDFPSPQSSYASSPNMSSDDSDDLDNIIPTVGPLLYMTSEFDSEWYSQTFSEERNDYFIDPFQSSMHNGAPSMMSPQTADTYNLATRQEQNDLAALFAVFGPTLMQQRPTVYGSPFTEVYRDLQTYTAMSLNFST